MASFVISDVTRKILGNFANINKSLLIREGRVQRTVAQGKYILGVAEFLDAWPVDTGIYELGTFLSTLNLFDAPKIEFGERAMKISETNRPYCISYTYSDPTTILTPPEKNFKTDNPSVEFTITAADLALINKTTSMLKLPDVKLLIEGSDNSVVFQVSDVKNPASHKMDITIEKDVIFHDAHFSFDHLFKAEHLSKLMDGSYTVQASNWPYAYFTHKTEPVKYYVVVQK